MHRVQDKATKLVDNVGRRTDNEAGCSGHRIDLLANTKAELVKTMVEARIGLK